MSSWKELQREEADIAKLNQIIAKWRLPGFCLVKPFLVIPDTCNRENTGLSAVHAHWLACQIVINGFNKRDNERGTGHDMPILVQEDGSSGLGSESFHKWHKTSSEGVLLFFWRGGCTRSRSFLLLMSFFVV